jgi:hypothetical protein
MTLTRIYNFADGNVLTAAQLDNEFNNILSKINGNIGDTEISSGDKIALTKLAASYAFATVTINFSIAAGGWPATFIPRSFIAFPAQATELWNPVSARWQTNNAGTVGAAAAAFNISWGHFNPGVVGTWVTEQTITSVATVITDPTVNACGQQGSCVINTTALSTADWGGAGVNHRGFSVVGTVADATVMAAATDVFSLTLLLKRQLTA